MQLLFRTAAAAAACAIATTAAAQTITMPLDLPTGATIDLVIEKTGERSGAHPVPRVTATFRYRQAIESTKDGYVVTQTLTGVDGPPEAKATLEQATGAVKRIVFEADATLAPVKVRDRKALLDAVFDSMKSLMASDPSEAGRAASDKALAAARGLFEQMSDEQLAQTLLKEQGALSQLQGVEVDLSKPIVEVTESPNPFGGTESIKNTTTIKLETLDRKAGRATVFVGTALDPDSLKASALALVERTAPAEREKAKAELATANMAMTNSCRYEMDLKTGLAAKSDCTKTITALGADGAAERRVERMVITQTLKLP